MNWAISAIIIVILLIVLWNIYNNTNKSTPIIYKSEQKNQEAIKTDMIRADVHESIESKSSSHLPAMHNIKKTEPYVQNELEDMYRPLNKDSRLDPLVQKNGNCPFSKPMSSDLPIANIPMCYAKSSKSHLKNT